MKKLFLMLILFFIIANHWLKGCLFHFEPEKFLLVLNKETKITIFVELEHRKCDIPLEDTNYSADGIKILKKGEWKKVKRNYYKQELIVKAIKPGGKLRIWRDCEEKGISEACMNCNGCIRK